MVCKTFSVQRQPFVQLRSMKIDFFCRIHVVYMYNRRLVKIMFINYNTGVQY